MPRAPRVARARVSSRALAAARGFAALVVAAVAVASAPGITGVAEARTASYLTGTYERLAKDHVDAHGNLHDHYSEVLRIPGKAAVPLRLPAGHGLRAGTRIRVRADRTAVTAATTRPASEPLDVRSVERLSTPQSTLGGAGTISVLVILAYWTAPDSVTPARARAQFFDDDDKWFREVSYGQSGLAGAVTPWLKIPRPAGGRCFAGGEQILANATRAAAARSGTYDYQRYQRTVVYFPRCVGGDTAGVAGWAYEPGVVSWLNGYLDRRTTVHEQGHNHGLAHARSYTCTSSTGARVTLSASCTSATYGDPYDAMGKASYVAHFTGYRKYVAGWLGGTRRRTLDSPSPTTFTLPPFERPSTLPVVVVARSPAITTRSYWLEYRRPVGMDARVPAGATNGVLVHLVDTGKPGWLVDGTPGDKTTSTAVLPPGRTWTAPDGLRVSVGTITSTGARVTVTGARGDPTLPGPPQRVTAVPDDGKATLSWQAPAKDGGAVILGYDAVAVSGSQTVHLRFPANARTGTFPGLDNHATYAVSIRSFNSVGYSTAATTSVTPQAMPPSVRITSPPAGSVLTGTVRVSVAAAPNPVTLVPLDCVDVYLDHHHVHAECGSGTVAFDLRTPAWANGEHTLRAVAYDRNWRSGEVSHVVRFDNPMPVAAITSPATGTTFPDSERITIEATASVPHDPAVGITRVTLHEIGEFGYPVERATAYAAPYRFDVDVSTVYGARRYFVTAHAADGGSARSAETTVTIEHPPTTVTLAEPATDTVSGPAVRLAADVTVRAAASQVASVVFYADGAEIGRDTTAPYETTWDTSSITGSRRVFAIVYETTGRAPASPARVLDVANVLPTVEMTSPAPSGQVPQGMVRIAGTAAAGAGGEAPDRVVVTVGGADHTVPVAADGTWALDWDGRTAYDWYAVHLRAYTPGGLHQRVVRSFRVVRPPPAVAVLSPDADVTVTAGSTVDIAVAAAPAADDSRTVHRVCVRPSNVWRQECTDARGADGAYHFPWVVNGSAGDRIAIYASVVMSDWSEYQAPTRWVTIGA